MFKRLLARWQHIFIKKPKKQIDISGVSFDNKLILQSGFYAANINELKIRYAMPMTPPRFICNLPGWALDARTRNTVYKNKLWIWTHPDHEPFMIDLEKGVAL